MADQVPNGKHAAHVIDYGVGANKNTGNLEVSVQFKLDGDGSEVWWHGYLKSEASQKITFDALQKVLGMQGDDLTTLSGGAGSGILDEKKTVELVIENEEWQGTMRSKVKWVNEVGGGGIRKEVDASTLSQLKSLNGKFKARRKETGATASEPELDF